MFGIPICLAFTQIMCSGQLYQFIQVVLAAAQEKTARESVSSAKERADFNRFDTNRVYLQFKPLTYLILKCSIAFYSVQNDREGEYSQMKILLNVSE